MFEKILTSKWKLAIKVIPFVAVILVLKLTAHKLGIEFMGLSPLFTALVSANIFLIGFLISGVLSDYKESEKLPSDLASSLDAILDECLIIAKNKRSKDANNCIIALRDLAKAIINWFQKKEKTVHLLQKISGFNDFWLKFEPLTQANFIVRMKQEQSNIRRIINRIHYIRETDFNSAGYAISEIITAILSIGLIFVKIEPFYEGIFFIVFVPFILIYMIFLIKDLDNPFNYYGNKETSDEISLKPIVDFAKKL